MLVRDNIEIKEIHLGEISNLIIESTAVSLTAALLNELIKRKINVIFCDEKRNPTSHLVQLYGSHDTSRKVRIQSSWNESVKKETWTKILTEKIKNQAILLEKIGDRNYTKLEEYAAKIQPGDKTNMEGVASRVYFSRLFGNKFSRKDESLINAALDYGYTIILSCVNREIVSNGYITQLGIGHSNVFNHFNLGSDIVEPLRPFVDEIVYENDFKKFDLEEKLVLVDLLNTKFKINNRMEYFSNAVSIYVKSVLEILSLDKEGDIKFIEF